MPTLTALSASVGEIDTSDNLSAAQLFGKVFIANGANLKVIDWINTKLTTTNLGANPPDFSNTLTGVTSGAVMVVDYITALSSACTIYGKKTTAANTFASGETVTGLDDDGNAISFVLSANEVAPAPHWYDWTVYGNSATFGVLPARAYLVATYQARVVVGGDPNNPNQWWMSKSTNPWMYAYEVNNDLSANYGLAGPLGQTGDLLRALIPYKDDRLLLGCASTIKAIVGNPSAGGEMAEIDLAHGLWGADSWCFDNQGFLYFISANDGLCKMNLVLSTTTAVSVLPLPKFLDGLSPTTHRMCLGFDSERQGIVITITTLLTGVCTAYFYSLKTEGFFPFSTPNECGVYSMVNYLANNPDDRGLLFGCRDGYIRKFDPTAKSDNVGATTQAIDAELVLPIIQMGTEVIPGCLRSLNIETGGGAADGTFGDSDSVTVGVFPGDSAEAVAEDIQDGATPAVTATVTGPGRQFTVRSRARGHYVGLRLSNSTADSTFSINRLTADTNDLPPEGA